MPDHLDRLRGPFAPDPAPAAPDPAPADGEGHAAPASGGGCAAETLRLYHAGYVSIPRPDVRYGRANADLGQGFYLTDTEAFARAWPLPRPGSPVVLNRYELDTRGLRVLRMDFGPDWLDYLLRCRAGLPDRHADADLIVAPVSNDTLFNSLGAIVSGAFSRAQMLRLLSVGPRSLQYALKSERAAAQLRWLGDETLTPEEERQLLERRKAREQVYLRQLAAAIEALGEGDE